MTCSVGFRAPSHGEILREYTDYIGENLSEAPIGGLYKANVTVVDQIIDAASGTFGVRLTLPNPKNTIPVGLKCKVRFSSQ